MNIDNGCFGFVGLGLIGGSIAKAIRRVYPSATIIAYNRTFTVAQKAQAEGIADIICQEVDETFSDCDYIFLCMPVSYNVQYLRRLAPLVKQSCILTDVGSSKSDIHEHVKRLGLETQFIGGHPMAGSDKTGYGHATSHLIDGAYYIITPTEQSNRQSVENYQKLVSSLGACPMVLDCHKHDYMTAAISHVPHLAASALACLARDLDTDGIMGEIAAGGFRDTTRIAASSPTMWQQICLTNSENICKVLDSYIELLQSIRAMVHAKSDESIFRFLDEARQYRCSLPENKTGLSSESF